MAPANPEIFYHLMIDTNTDYSHYYTFEFYEEDPYYSELAEAIYRITQADADHIFNFFNNLEIENKNDDTVMDIIREEVEIFWAGQYTAEKCAENIQNRVYIYVNEQR